MTAEFKWEQMRGIRRGFIDIEEGQVHYRTCGAGDGPPMLMLHGSPGSSYSLVPYALRLGKERRVIAIDTLGNGDSSPAGKAQPEIADYADAHWRALQALGIERFDLYGYHTGTSIAMEIAIAHPQAVRSLILDGVSMFTEANREWLFRADHAPEIPIDADGSQFARSWAMVRDAHIFWPWWNREPEGLRGRGLPSSDYLHGEVLEVLKATRSYYLSYRAALRYDKRTRAALLTQPVLVTAGPRDQLHGALEAAAQLLPNSRKAVIAGIDTEADVEASVGVFEGFLRMLGSR